MRNPSDQPPRGPSTRSRRRFSDKGRVILIVLAVVVVGILLFGRFFAGFYTDYLWFDSVGRAGVFSTVLRAKLLLFFLFGGVFVALAVLNLVIADRLAPSAFSANTHPVVERFHEFFGHRLRLLRVAVAVIAGLLFAAPAVGHWQDWLMFNNQQRFAIADPQFHHDVGFYMFRLPFIAFVIDWLFAALVFITLLVIATHVLSGGIIIQPPRPKVRRATKAHVAVLLAVLAIVKAGDYWLKRYELTNDSRGFVRGLLYSAAHAQLPATVLLMLIALLVAGLFLSTLRTNSWRLPVVASALWAVIALVGGIIYPAAIQALVVKPNQRDKEQPYIERNIAATRHALGIEDVSLTPVSFDDISAGALESDVAPLRDVRLLKPEAMVGRFRTDQSQQAGLTINDLDPDRYVIDGREQQVSIAARELDLANVANKSWQGKHLIYTHGCGIVSAPAGEIRDRRPVYEEIPLQRPELYFADDISGYAIVDTGVNEEVCPNHTDPGPYTGGGGIKLNSVFKRMAFALSYLDYNLIGSGAIDDNSRLLTIRSVEARAKKLAPFLSYDGDPYPVALDGRVLWVIDAYTTSDRYPYGESGDRSQLSSGSGLDHPFNYVRNSIKVVVDAYTGNVDFYVIDQNDPIAKVWVSAFPGLFKSRDQMPKGLDAHLRYPEELFRVQTAAYSKYRVQDPQAFFGRTGAWSVAQAPVARPRPGVATTTANSIAGDTAGTQDDLATESRAERFVPYYSMLRAPGETSPSFKLLRPFVPFSTDDSKRNLQAFMTASSDPKDYGKLMVYEVTSANDGPATVSNTMNSEAAISQQVSLLNIEGTDVVYGDLQMIPVANGLLWVRPVYVQPSVPDVKESQPTIELVLVSQNNQATYGSSLTAALARLFPGFNVDVGDVVGNTPTPPDNGGTNPPPTTDKTPEQMLDDAQNLFAEADKALEAHDLATYQSKVNQARTLIQQALDALGQG